MSWPAVTSGCENVDQLLMSNSQQAFSVSNIGLVLGPNTPHLYSNEDNACAVIS